MRVLIPNHFPLEGSGSGIYTQNVARELVAKGHQALTICPDHQEEAGYPFETRTILFTPDEGAEADAARLPFNFPCFTTHPRSSTTFADLDAEQRAAYVQAFQSAIDDAVADWKPDVIHAMHLWVTGYAATKTGVPTVATAHGTDLMGFKRYADWRELALEGVRKTPAVIAISRQVAADTSELYDVPREKIRLIMNGFDESIFHTMVLDRTTVLHEFGIGEPPRALIMFVGKLTKFKGIDVLLDAAAIYEAALPGVMTLIIGEGELHDQLRLRAADLHLKQVHFLGQQPQSEIARLLNVADLSIVPSRVEPFGLVAVEALACGTPVVATNAGGLPDFINQDVGWLVEVDDPDGLAQAVIEAVQSDARSKKGLFAADYASQHFAWSQQVDKMVDVYHEVLGGDELV
jgi:glycosyltransferase involved in cell wall biosynthesis